MFNENCNMETYVRRGALTRALALRVAQNATDPPPEKTDFNA